MAIKRMPISNFVSGVTNYALDEILTGGVWIDGKPVYRRIFTNSISIAGNGTTELPIGADAIDTVIRIDGYVRYSDSTAPILNLGRPASGAAYTRSIDLIVNLSNRPALRIRSGASTNAIEAGAAWFLIEYTKP